MAVPRLDGIDGLDDVLAALKRLDRDATKDLRADSKESATELARRLKGAAEHADAPQAARFARYISPRSDRLVKVVVRVGSSKFVRPFGVFNGTEYGSKLKRFHTSPNKEGTWLWSGVRRYTPEAMERWRATVRRLIAETNARKK